MHSPNDRRTSFIDIRIDNIISHKTLQKEDLSEILKIRNKSMIQITTKGEAYISSVIEDEKEIILLSLLVQNELHSYTDIYNKLQLFMEDFAALNLLGQDTDYFNIKRTDLESFLNITRKGKKYLNDRIRSI